MCACAGGHGRVCIRACASGHGCVCARVHGVCVSGHHVACAGVPAWGLTVSCDCGTCPHMHTPPGFTWGVRGYLQGHSLSWDGPSSVRL